MNLEFSQESPILDIYRCGYCARRCAPGCAARGILIARKSGKYDAGGRDRRRAPKEYQKSWPRIKTAPNIETAKTSVRRYLIPAM